MPWEVRLLEDLKIVETIYSGHITPQDLQDAVIATTSLAHESNTNRYLSDCVGLERGHSIVDLFDLVESLYQGAIAHLAKEAIVLPESEDVERHVHFYETACRNRGFNVRAFRDRQAAIAWLNE